MTEPQCVSCRIGSQNVTCHPTQANTHRQAGNRFTYPRGMEG